MATGAWSLAVSVADAGADHSEIRKQAGSGGGGMEQSGGANTGCKCENL